MEPAYRDGLFNFSMKIRCLFSEVKRFDLVAIRFAGTKEMLPKGVIAFEGKEVEKGYLYMVGDNRSMPMEKHLFG